MAHLDFASGMLSLGTGDCVTPGGNKANGTMERLRAEMALASLETAVTQGCIKLFAVIGGHQQTIEN